MFLVVLQTILSNNIKNAGNTDITVIILMIAPLDTKLHNEARIPIFEYTPTPTFAANKNNPLTTIDCIYVPNASSIASYFVFPFILAVLYFVVINIA